MKTATILFFFAVVSTAASAQLYPNPYSNPWLLNAAAVSATAQLYPNPWLFNAAAVAPQGAAGVTPGASQCFPQRCQACKDSFLDEPIVTFDCEGKCGLCALCQGSPNNVSECDRWCKLGEHVCAANCNKGKALCLACSGYCGVF